MLYSLIRGSFSVAVLATLAGCVSPVDETSNAMQNAERASNSGGGSAAAEKPAERTAEKSTAGTMRSEDRGATARDSRSGGDPGRADVVAQLNEVSRELATLRAANAKLRAERSSSGSSTGGSRAEPADDRLNSTLRSYGQFRQELANVVADMEKLKAENAALAAQLKEAKTKADQSATVARLEKELQSERAARVESERTIAALRDQLRAVARAVNAAGVAAEGGSTGNRTGGR